MFSTKRSKFEYPIVCEQSKTVSETEDAVPVNLISNIDKSWFSIFLDEEYSINDRLYAMYRNAYDHKIIARPDPKDVLNVFDMPIDKIKVVIVGQDPYPGFDKTANHPIANGRAFSTNSTTITSSLERIFESISNNVGEIQYKDYTLKGWIEQGVFLLNETPVTYVIPEDSSISNKAILEEYPRGVWSGITLEICKKIHEKNKKVEFVFIGKKAEYLSRKFTKSFVENHPSKRSDLNFEGKCFINISTIDWKKI